MRKPALAALAAGLSLLASGAAHAEANNILMVPSCGSQSLNAGNNYLGVLTVDSSGRLCDSGAAVGGGLSSFFVQPVASDNHAVIKNGAGQIYSILATNNSATINYLRLYNAGTGFNGCNSATNLVMQIAIPASASGASIVYDNSIGLAFAAGISICITSGYATNDTTAATAAAMSVTVAYK